MRIIAYHTTDPYYTAEAKRLRASVERFGIPLHVQPIEVVAQENGEQHEGPWSYATARKAAFIANCREVFSGPLVYLDVDAFVHHDFRADLAERTKGADFAAHWFNQPIKGGGTYPRMLSGTLWFGDTANARRLLDAWLANNRRKQINGDFTGGGQRNLWEVLDRDAVPGLQQVRLPGRYTRVYRKPEQYPPGEPIWIEHLIASRENRGPSRGKVDAVRRERVAELEVMLT